MTRGNMWVTVARSESSHRTAQSPWRRLRQRVLKRDGWECQIRGPRCLGDATMVDHIIPVSMGGTDDEDNAQAVCKPCHDSKTARERAALRPPRKRRTAIHPADAAHDLLQALLPMDARIIYNFHKGLLRHGQRICVFERPRCQKCPITDLCDYYKNNYL